jgi:hypothetical protein
MMHFAPLGLLCTVTGQFDLLTMLAQLDSVPATSAIAITIPTTFLFIRPPGFEFHRSLNQITSSPLTS